ncbi:MAG TPA: phage major capsid protein [Xanthobacteraceae bacterium]|nr:phage major capsid protein [Xanthobacteraceae bacterium]
MITKPVPSPSGGETEDEYVNRCMGDDAMQEYDQDQRAAICYQTFRDRSLTPEAKMRSIISRQPEPNEGETREDFVDRCMAFEGLADRDPDQRAAICNDAYRQYVAPPDEDGEAAFRPRDKLSELKRRRAGLVARMQAIVKAEDELVEGENLTPCATAEFEQLRKDIAALDARLARQQYAMAADASASRSEGTDMTIYAGGMNRGGMRVWAEPKKRPRQGKGLQAARWIISLAHVKWYGAEKAAEFIWNNFHDEEVAKAALNTQVVSEGGALIPQDFLQDLIELLRANTVVRGAGPMTVGMPLGNLTIPRLAGGASASYQGELDDIELTHQVFDDVNLRARKLTAMVPVSNDLLRRAPFGVEEIVRDDLVQTIARKEDVTFLRSDGSDMAPVGWRGWVMPDNLIVIAAGGDLNAVVAGIAAMKLTLINGLSRMLRPAWFMAPEIIEFIRTRRDDVGGFYYKDEVDRGTLDGIPIHMSQLIPTNLGDGRGSEIYLVDMADTVLADTMQVQVDASDVAAYYGTDGKVISTFQRDQSLFRIISAHDFNMRHLQSLAIGLVNDWKFEGLAGSPGAPWSTQPLNTTWAQAPAAWPAVETGADDPPRLWDPGASQSAAFDGPLTNRPGGLPRPEEGGEGGEGAAAPPPPPPDDAARRNRTPRPSTTE